ncbi:MAG TPA: AsnC family transcriptional regulator [Rubrivivax sp.]|nr:AsnC family transcriptional regulator [Rubrivivax sp.]HPO21000.1 AsnC family transcriptional regulator [Rubrivivax sp.]
MLDELDRALIKATQAGLPLVARPYDAVGAQLGVAGEVVRERLAAMLERGLVRRIGAVPNHYKLGYTANGMSVWDVDDAQVDALGERLVGVSGLSGISHCYRRPRALPHWPYNLFVMLHGRSRDQVQQQANAVAALLGDACRGHQVLYSTAILKKTGLRL